MAVVRDEVSEVARWDEGIERVHECIAGRFRRPEPRRRALDYLRGLLSPVERKNGWQLAEQAGVPPRTGCSPCCTATAGTRIWSGTTSGTTQWSIRGSLAEGVLVVEEIGFLKKGSKSVRVQRQYTGTAGQSCLKIRA